MNNTDHSSESNMLCCSQFCIASTSSHSHIVVISLVKDACTSIIFDGVLIKMSFKYFPITMLSPERFHQICQVACGRFEH